MIPLSVSTPIIVILRPEDGFEYYDDKAEYYDKYDYRYDVCHMMNDFQMMVVTSATDWATEAIDYASSG